MFGPFAAARPFAQRLKHRLHRLGARRTPSGDTIGDVDPRTLATDTPIAFRCNLCGAPNRAALSALDREAPSCRGCGSNVRFRAMGYLVAREVLGVSAALPDLPVAKGVRGIGLSDADAYAVPLAQKLDYVNTYFHREPRLDIAAVDPARHGRYDFIVSSDVFEHVVPPVGRAFENACKLLRPGGKLIFTVPFSLAADTVEHFPGLHEWEISERDGRWRLVNRTPDGAVMTYDDLIFHGGPGTTLEMRVFSQAALMREFERAGFARVRMAAEPYLPFGIHWPEPWSVPMVACR
jgi:SAM-dependent methyltransferase